MLGRRWIGRETIDVLEEKIVGDGWMSRCSRLETELELSWVERWHALRFLYT